MGVFWLSLLTLENNSWILLPSVSSNLYTVTLPLQVGMAAWDAAEPVLHLCNWNTGSVLFQLLDLECILLNSHVKPRSFCWTALTAGLCGGCVVVCLCQLGVRFFWGRAQLSYTYLALDASHLPSLRCLISSLSQCRGIRLCSLWRWYLRCESSSWAQGVWLSLYKILLFLATGKVTPVFCPRKYSKSHLQVTWSSRNSA